MHLRSLIPSVVLLASLSVSYALDVPVRLNLVNGKSPKVILLDYKDGDVTFKLNPSDLNKTTLKKSKIKAIYFYEPKLFTEAMALYKGRHYKQAKEKFAQLETKLASLNSAPNNYSTLSGFYKMECSRRLMDLKALSEELKTFNKKGLTRETHLQQLEVNAFWDAVRLKEWKKIDDLAKKWQNRKIAGGHRAQIEYCHALALEQLAKKDPALHDPALNAFNRVLTADFGASSELLVASVEHALGIYLSDPEVKTAMNLWKTKHENPHSNGYRRLLEANALVKFYQQTGLNHVKALNKASLKLLKYELPKSEKQPETKKK